MRPQSLAWPMLNFELTYEVFRFNQWWKSKIIVRDTFFLRFDEEENVKKYFTRRAESIDLWKVRNLKYKLTNKWKLKEKK